jgi:hypothetical protein
MSEMGASVVVQLTTVQSSLAIAMLVLVLDNNELFLVLCQRYFPMLLARAWH